MDSIMYQYVKVAVMHDLSRCVICKMHFTISKSCMRHLQISHLTLTLTMAHSLS